MLFIYSECKSIVRYMCSKDLLRTYGFFSPLNGVFQRLDSLSFNQINSCLFFFSFKSDDFGICERLELEGTLEIICASGS